MNKKKIIFTILLAFIISLSSSVVFAEDIANNISTQDTISTINENANVISASQHTISAGSNSSTIQNTINNMSDGDELVFENGVYTDICIYIDKSITITGNNATLIGYDSPGANNTHIPSKVRYTTAQGGYAVTNFATVYLLNTTDLSISGLTIVGKDTSTYSNAALYIEKVNNIEITNNTIEGSSWGIYMTYSNDGYIADNTIANQTTTGLLNFGSARTLITNNTVINAKNHGIDVRHGVGPNVQVINNTVIGSKEGIYLMHSKGHTAAQNTIINCSISSISCYGASSVEIYDNNMVKSRIGVLLGGGYSNITIGENKFNLDNLPFPPTFVYYVATAESKYQSATDMIGKYSDSSDTNDTYTNITNIPVPKDIDINYTAILSETGNIFTVPEGATGTQIQSIIDSMSNGDTLEFAANAVYENICIYTDKNIKIIGNNATLVGYPNKGTNGSNIPSKVRNTTANGGYGVTQLAVLYVLNSTNPVVYNLNIVGNESEYDLTNVTTTTDEYKVVGLYAEKNNNITITGCDISGSTWGIFLQYNTNAVVTNNNIHDEYVTGIMNFGSKNSIIANNTVTNALNHGIDVRHGTGPNVTVFNNTITGSKEGIYLMHSKGHTVYNNTIINSKISSITAYGSGEEYIFNNTCTGSRIGVLLGGGYYNVTIGPNKFKLDTLPFPPTFGTYIAFADSKFQSAKNVQGVYSDGAYLAPATIIADNVNLTSTNVTYSAILKDNNGIGQANQTLSFEINGEIYNATTDANGTATINTILNNGEYDIVVSFAGNDKLSKKEVEATIIVNSTKAVDIEAPEIEMYYKNGTRFVITLTQNSTPIVNASIQISINGANYTRITDKNGIVSMAINLDSGKYPVEVNYAGNETYDPAMISSAVTVLSTVNGSDITKMFKNGTQYYATFVDNQGNYLPDGTEVTFNINGVMYNRKVSGDKGLARLNINLDPGVYTLTAINPVNGEMTSNNVTVLSQITENNDLVKHFKNNSQYRVKVLDSKGNAVGANETVVFNINGVMYERLTDEEGYAKLNINLAPGKYVITAMYGDSMVSNNITVLPILTASDLTKKYGTTNQFKANLVDAQGNPYAGQNVTFNINGVLYQRTTDTNGTAALNINLMPSVYIITSSYGDASIGNTVNVTQ